MHNGELAKKYHVSPLTQKRCPTKLGVMCLLSKCFAIGWKRCCIGVRLNSNKSDDLSTTCKSHGKNIFVICCSPLSRHYKKWG